MMLKGNQRQRATLLTMNWLLCLMRAQRTCFSRLLRVATMNLMTYFLGLAM